MIDLKFKQNIKVVPRPLYRSIINNDSILKKNIEGRDSRISRLVNFLFFLVKIVKN